MNLKLATALCFNQALGGGNYAESPSTKDNLWQMAISAKNGDKISA
jgi:hypothetical protein